MKFSIRYTLLALVLLGASAASAQIASNFCMDCAERTRPTINGGTTTTALCCTSADDGYCSGGYFVVQPNVGWGCQIGQNPDGTTYCNSGGSDTNCGGGPGGGGGGDTGGGGGEFNDCTNDGGCSAACSSCSFP